MYVQDVLNKQLSEEVWQALQSAGHVYVCGGMNMAQGVARALQEIVASQLGVTSTEAKEYMERLKVTMMLLIYLLHEYKCTLSVTVNLLGFFSPTRLRRDITKTSSEHNSATVK